MRRHTRNKKCGTLGYLAEGIICILLSFLIMSMIFSAVASLTKDPMSLTGIFSVIALILSFFVTGIFISLRKNEGCMILCLICALIGVGALLIAELIIKRGTVSIAFFINCLSSILSAMLGAAVVSKRRSKRKHRR